MLKDLFGNTDGEKLDFKDNQAEYKLSQKEGIIYLTIESNLSKMKAAQHLDSIVSNIIQGNHRKDFNIIKSYDEISHTYCCKLMPLFGTFERKTRELIYLTIVKSFGVEWFNESFEESLQEDLKEKVNVNKNKLRENALEELTYSQMEKYLFTPYSNKSLDSLLDTELSTSKLNNCSKNDIVKIIDSARKVSLWDRFFKSYKDLDNFQKEFEELRPYRNKVMHNKSLSKNEYDVTRKRLNDINKRLNIAINILEKRIYTKNDIVYSVTAFATIFDSIELQATLLKAIACKFESIPSINTKYIAELMQKMTDSLMSIPRPKLEIPNFNLLNEYIEDKDERDDN